MNEILNKLDGFIFDIEFNDPNINRLQLAKKIKPILFKFLCIDKEIEQYENDNQYNEDNQSNQSDQADIDIVRIAEIKKNIISKISQKIKSEHADEKDLIQIYSNKLKKYLSQIQECQENYNIDAINQLIKNIIETPLEGEIAKHNKIKVINVRLIKKEMDIDVLFYVKYKECDGYNKQITNLLKNILL